MPSSNESRAGGADVGRGVWLGVVALAYLLLVGVGVVGAGFKWVSGPLGPALAILAGMAMIVVSVVSSGDCSGRS